MEALQRERIELSQAIYDTAARTAYVNGLGMDAAADSKRNFKMTAGCVQTANLSDVRRKVWVSLAQQ